MQIYSKSMKNPTSLSFLGRFWFCLFLSDRAWCRLQNFYTEFWNSLIMQIYSKSMKNATSLSFLGRFLFCLVYLIGLGAGFKTSTQNFEIHYANLCKFIQNQWKCYFSVISWAILILFVLSDRAWLGLQNYQHIMFERSLVKQVLCIFVQNCNREMLLLNCHIRLLVSVLFYLIGLGGGFKTFNPELWNALIMLGYEWKYKSKINEKCRLWYWGSVTCNSSYTIEA